ncbi:hypothetical protein CR513_29018, partial [Mucuna pruriens]
MTLFMAKIDERIKAMKAKISTLAILMTQQVQGPPPPPPLQIKSTLKEEIEKKVVLPRDETPPRKPQRMALMKVNVPFPQRLKDKKKDNKFARFLEIFRKIHINILFIEVITQMPNYAKLLKNIMSNKKKLEEFEVNQIVSLSFALRETHILRRHCNLYASINIIPYSYFEKLGLQEP